MRRIVSLLPFVCVSVLSVACRNSSVTSATGSGGNASTSTVTGTTTTVTGGTTAATTSTGGMVCPPDAPAHTIQEITSGNLGNMTAVTLKGVVAMSKKFLVSGKTSCLWGVFVSAPGLTETAENTGILALSYGTPPVVPPGGTTAFCPEHDASPPVPAGDSFPDDVKPGDVLDLVGTTASFPTMFNCMAPDPSNSVPMRQFSQVCSVTRTGTAAVPKAHVLTGADIASLTSTTDSAFHDKWGGVKVRLEGVTAELGMTSSAKGPDCSSDPTKGPPPPCVVRNFGNVVVDAPGAPACTTSPAPCGVPFGDKMYYRGYQKTQVCHSGPTYPDPATGMPGPTFTFVEGFHYLDFCNWGLQVQDKCADLSPASPDCAAASPAITSCP